MTLHIREILEIRTRITELLDSHQPEVAVGDLAIAPVACDELDAISLSSTRPELFLLPQPPVLHGQLSDQEYSPLESSGVAGSLSEGADSLVGQASQVSSAISSVHILSYLSTRS
ncbi:hypothetical protein DFH29DRAFT_875936 [Suillus ampliporus]|nr:hypothetical protein DFH29DRAFT_875936 [Suillus ampliporus]